MGYIIDTAINGQGSWLGKAYFFKNDQYVRYDWNSEQIDAGFPLSLSAWNLPTPFLQGLHATLNGSGRYAGKAYFFRGNQYIRYDWATGQVDPGYPLNLSAWGLPIEFLSGIDAAINGSGRYAGKAYFFKGNRYARYDWVAEKVDFIGDLSAWKLPSPTSRVIDLALEGQGKYKGKAYFFRHNVYTRYDWATEVCDAGYPASIRLWNIPEIFLYSATPIRDHLWYITIDDYDYFQYGNNGHNPNLSRLQEIAQTANIQVDPIWMANLKDEFLSDRTLLALFGAGSFPEWFNRAPSSACWNYSNKNSTWKKQLDQYCAQIRATKVPMFAVCGTHQLVAYAFADWKAVGHMTATQPIRTINDEFITNQSLIPIPRLGEVGVFPFRIRPDKTSDPLLAGLSGKLWFEEQHHDQVILNAYNPNFEILLEPDPSTSPDYEKANDDCHTNPASFSDRCQVQALRLNRPDRVLYTTQFHPELPANFGSAHHVESNSQSEKLLRNFFKIASNFWTNK